MTEQRAYAVIQGAIQVLRDLGIPEDQVEAEIADMLAEQFRMEWD